MVEVIRPEWWGYVVLVVGVLMHICIGTMYCWGNLTTYATSYMRGKDHNIVYADTLWAYLSAAGVQAASMPFTGYVQIRFGSRVASLLGALMVAGGVALTRHTIDVSLAAFITTYGVLFGVGIGLIYACPIVCALSYLPKLKGLINGIVVMGFGFGAFVFNFVITNYLNPHNCKPQCPGPDYTYPDFTCPGYHSGNTTHEALTCKNKYFPPDSSVTQDVPELLSMLAAIYFAVLLPGALLMVPQGEPLLPSFRSEAPTAEEQKGLNASVTDRDAQRDADAEEGEVHTFKVMRTLLGWQIAVGFLLTGVGGAFIIGESKTYGQGFSWSSDKMESHLSSAMSIGNAGGRVIHGAAADRFGTAPVIAVSASLTAILIGTLTYTTAHSMLYSVWCVAITLLYGGNFALYPTATVASFGQKYFPANYGFVMSGFGVGALLIGVTNNTLIDSIGFRGMSFILASCALLGVINALTLVKRVPHTAPGRNADGYDSDASSTVSYLA